MTQADRMLSDKGNFLLLDPSQTQNNAELDKIFKSFFEELNNQSFAQRRITPLMQSLSTIKKGISDINDIQNPQDRIKLSENLNVDLLMTARLELELYIDIYRAASINTDSLSSSYREVTAELIKHGKNVDDSFLDASVDNAVSAESSIDDLIAQLSQRQSKEDENSQSDNDQPNSSKLKSEVYSMIASMINHRLGNLPSMIQECVSYLSKDLINERSLDEDRKRLVYGIDVRNKYLFVVSWMIGNHSHVTPVHLFEWAQLRIADQKR